MQYDFNLRPVDFVGQYMRGKTFREEMEELKRKRQDTEEAKSMLKQKEADALAERELIQDMRIANYYMDNGMYDQALAHTDQRMQRLSQQGRDVSDTGEIYNLMRSGDYITAHGMLKAGLAGLGQLQEKSKPKSENLTANVKDFLYYQKLLKEDEEQAQMFANKSGISKLSPEEQAELNAKSSGMKEAEKNRMNRLSGYVDSGVQQIGALKDTTRALSLLEDGVKTGKTQGLLLSAKNFFGIEAQDEAEASYLMGKRVLQQLKPIFGSAFTVGEVNKLEGIEAAFTSGNAKNNIRLLKEAQQTVLSAVKRAKAAANRLGEDFTEEELSNAIKAYNDGVFSKGFDVEKEDEKDEFEGFSIVN